MATSRGLHAQRRHFAHQDCLEADRRCGQDVQNSQGHDREAGLRGRTAAEPAPEHPDSQNSVLARIKAHREPSSLLLLGYTCLVCNTRSYKCISKVAYRRGIVVVGCRGCSSRHLICYHVGWFRENGAGTIEDILRSRGEEIRTNFTLQNPETDSDLQLVPREQALPDSADR